MGNRVCGVLAYIGMITVVGILLGASINARAGALNGLDHPDRVPGQFIVTLKREHLVSLKELALIDRNERTGRTEKWKNATAAVDSEVASRAAQLMTLHRGRLSYPVVGASLIPMFTIEASDEEARAISNESDVERVDALILIRNSALTTQSPAPSWGLDRIDKGDTGSTSILDNSYSYYATGYGANVYILDSGIRTDHVDFSGRATNDADFIGDGNPGWCKSNVSGAAAGHGTEVASIVQVDQAASSDQAVLWHDRERREDADLDRGLDLRARRHRQKAVEDPSEPLRNATDIESDHVRANPFGYAVFSNSPGAKRRLCAQPDEFVPIASGHY
jgi:hypothetical protein